MATFNAFTDQEKDFIQKNFHSMTLQQIAEALGRSYGGVKTWSRRLGLRRNLRFVWSDDRVQILTEMYPNRSAKETAQVLKTEPYVIYKKAERLNLKKSPEYLAALNRQMGENLQKNGYATRFEKGQKPWCTGKKIGSRGRSVETQFKKGHIPHNHLKVGDIAKPSGYWKIKLAEPNVWKPLHHYLWENAHGEIPKGKCIVFKDGNVDNCVLENLECVTRKNLYARNSVHNLPEDLKQTVQTLGRLKRAINRSIKNAEK